MKRAVMGLALLALLAVMHSADAQRRRLPSRTDPIPDTETGGRAGSASSTEPSNPSLMIYGPPVAPLGAPPSPPVQVPEAKPAPAVAPAQAPIVSPAPASAPVVTPTPPPPAPVAVPIPAPPPPPVAAPAPQAPPPAPVAAPAPPVALPPPAVAPPPIAAPIPPPPPAAVPAPIAAPPPPPAPAPVAAPVAKPEPVAKPAPVVKPAPDKREVAAIAPAAAAAQKLDPKLVEQIFSCLAPGLPSDWKKTWVVVSAEPAGAAKFYVTTSYRDEDAEEFVPCNAAEVARRIASLSDALPLEQRRWKSARLQIDSEGSFALNYDNAR